MNGKVPAQADKEIMPDRSRPLAGAVGAGADQSRLPDAA